MSEIGTVAIIGAGISGLASALAFERLGAKVHLFEQAAELTEVGAGLQISPNGRCVLNALDLAPQSTEILQKIDRIELVDGLSGRPIVQMPLGHFSPGYGAAHRADLIEMLYCAAYDRGVSVTFAARQSAQDLDQFDLVIAADGLHSDVRHQLNGQQSPKFTGQVAWRATVPMGPKVQDHAKVALAPGQHLVTYPLRSGRLLNVVAIEERAEWTAESWSSRGDVHELRDRFAGLGPSGAAILDQVTQCHLWGLFKHPIAPKWSDQARIALVGDAAHPTLPFMAQGANLALEDAWVLAECVRLQGRARGLLAYQRARQTRVARALAAADANARNFHLRNPIIRKSAHLGLSAMGLVAPKALTGRLSWLYEHDVTAGHYAD